jgi:hypothetical protein
MRKNEARQRNKATAFETPRCWPSTAAAAEAPAAGQHDTKPKRQNNGVRDAKVLVGHGGGG